MVGRNHIVRVGFNYDLMLPSAPRDRTAGRRAFGFAPDEVVYVQRDQKFQPSPDL
jgi:hypothetical protein